MRPPLERLCVGSRRYTAGIRHTRGDEGAVEVLTAVGGLIVAAVAVAMIAATAGVGVTAARARTAADAAALAAMAASPVVSGAGLPEREAARAASANGARLVEVDTAGWPLRVRVTVEVRSRGELHSLRMPPLRAHATAAARPSG